MNWRIKGVVQKTLSGLPGGLRINDWLQVTLGDLRQFEKKVDGKVVDDWVVFLNHMGELAIKPQDLNYLEIGTGWFPTLPVCFALAGARSCMTYDLTRHLNSRHTFRMVRRLQRHLTTVAKVSGTPLEDVRLRFEALERCHDVPELLRVARINYFAPVDAANTGLPDNSIDVVYSNSVLEHVPAEIIRKLMQESHRVLRPGGVAIHSVNCGDHYAYFDRNITFANYLTFTEKRWALWNNRLLYQNRLRPQDFVEMVEDAHMKVILFKSKPRPELLKILPELSIAAEFRKYSPEQLCTTSVDFVAQR